MSPYVYCAGNPVDFVDVEGMIFTQESYELLQVLWDTIQKMRDRNERAIERHQAKLYESGISKGKERRQIKKIAKLMSRNSALDEVLVEVDEMASSSQTYNLVYSDEYNTDTEYRGGSKYNVSTGEYDMLIPQGGGVAMIAHELKHGYQFETGTMSSGKSRDLFYDRVDEVDAYARGAIFGGPRYTLFTLPERYKKLPKEQLNIMNRNDFKKDFGNSTAVDRHRYYQIVANTKKSAYRINGFTYVGEGIE